MKRVITILLICLTTVTTFAQQKDTVVNNALTDSNKINERLLLQQQEQYRVDSLVNARLQQELALVAGDDKRKKELEDKIHQLTIADSIRKAEQKQKIEELKKTAKGYAVNPFHDTLFYIYTGVGSFNAQERAAAITQKIRQLYEDDFYKQDSLLIVQNENNVDIVYDNNVVIVSVSTLDALWMNTTKAALANEYFTKIKAAVSIEKQQNSFNNLVKRIVWVIVSVIGFGLLIYCINLLFRQIRRLFIKNKDKYFKGISIGKFKIFTPEAQRRFVMKTTSIIRIVVILILIYLSLPLIFSVFPQTKKYTETLLNWIIAPARRTLSATIAFLPNLFTIVVIYLFTHYAAKAIRYFADQIEMGNLEIKGFHKDFVRPTYNIIRFLLYAFMLIVVFPYLPGSGSPAFQGVSVFLGVLISLGSSSAIANIISGLVITYMRPFKIGDRVKIGEVTGDVLEKTMLVTRILTIKNEEITVPNSNVLSSHTINYSANATTVGLIVHTTVTIGYDVPWQQMHKALIDAALRTDHILKDPQPFVLQTSLDDFYVSYQINAYTHEANLQAVIYSDLHRHIQDSCNEAGIEIMSPHYNAMRDGNMTTIPADYLPKDYVTPSFNVKSTDSNAKANKEKGE